MVMDGVRGAMFMYGTGGAFIGSWASKAGTDPYGNSYPQGFNGALGVIAGTDFLVYNGTPGLGTLIGSWSGSGGVDIYGNAYPQGFMVQDTAGTAQGIFTVQDSSGNTVLSIDNAGNISGNVGSFNDLNVGGLNLNTDILPVYSQGIVNYGFMLVGGTAWPGTAIGTTEVALWELDQIVPAGRVYEFSMDQTIINLVGGAASCHLYVHYTQDGSTPTTASALATTRASRVENIATDAAIGPVNCIFGPFVADTTIRALISGKTGGNSF